MAKERRVKAQREIVSSTRERERGKKNEKHIQVYESAGFGVIVKQPHVGFRRRLGRNDICLHLKFFDLFFVASAKI